MSKAVTAGVLHATVRGRKGAFFPSNLQLSQDLLEMSIQGYKNYDDRDLQDSHFLLGSYSSKTDYSIPLVKRNPPSQ